jgi:hypothetical protein
MKGDVILGSGAFCGKDCDCGGPCDCLPSEFARLRYAYGMRLGSVEFSDEQSYLVGKDRFHNMHCHGAGVLCGLRADRFVWPQGAPPGTSSTVLRVSRGAALDGCGREVLVPCDQCIDVAAWFAINGPNLDPPPAAGPLHICVALRYRECPSDPAPVPRDPCGCDTGGCDFTRVRESFELRLFAGQSPACAGAIFPSEEALLAALDTVDGSAPTSLSATLDTLTAQPCPAVANSDWICLAAFDATLTAPGPSQTVTDVSVPDNTIAGRRPLLSTGALQTLLLGVVNVVEAEGLLGAGPSVGGISFTGAGNNAGTLVIGLDLITDPPGTTPTPLAFGTFSPNAVQVHQFNSTTWAWDQVTPTATGHIASDGAQISITWGSGDPALSAGNFRVFLGSPQATPIVDERMRPLRPTQFARDFGLALNAANTLALAAISV